MRTGANEIATVSCDDCELTWKTYCPICKSKGGDKNPCLVVGSVKKKKKVIVYENSRGLCGICGKPVSLNEMTIDHIFPKSKGGTNSLDNLQASHKECNSKKGSRIITTIGDFLNRVSN